jgi:hypothetical protein
VFQTLTLGGNNGAVGSTVLTFASEGLTPASATTHLACSNPLIQIGVRVTDKITVGDCKADPSNPVRAFLKDYRLNVPAATKAIRLSHSSYFEAMLVLQGPNEQQLFFGQGGGNMDFSIKAFLPPGVSKLRELARAAGGTGSFTFSVDARAEDDPADECEFTTFQSPLSTTQTLRPECRSAGNFISDFFDFGMMNGKAVTVSVTGAAFEPLVALIRTWPTGGFFQGTTSGNTATLTHVNQSDNVEDYYLVVTSTDSTGTGAYTLQATIAPASGLTVQLRSRAGAAAVAAPMLRKPSGLVRTSGSVRR